MNRYIEVNELPRLKFHPLPYTHITPADIKDAEAYERGWNDAIDAIIENAPTADVPERNVGKWIVDEKRFGNAEHHCNLCGAILEGDEWKWRNNYFCYYCGAEMDGGKDDDRNR